MKNLLGLFAFCFLLMGCGIAASQWQVSAEQAESFTVSYGNMNYNGDQNEGLAFFDFIFTTENENNGFTSSELNDAFESAREHICLNGQPLSSLTGEIYFLRMSDDGKGYTINLPQLNFIYNWTGSAWDYENTDFSRLENYKVEVKEGFSIGGKTLGQNYVRYYNNVAHVWTTKPVTQTPDHEIEAIKVTSVSPITIDAAGTAGFQVHFSSDFTTRQLMFYNASLNNVKGWFGGTDDDFARAVCHNAWRSLQQVFLNYTSAAGNPVQTTIGDAIDSDIPIPEHTLMIHYLADANVLSLQPMSINFNKDSKEYFPDITKPVTITFPEGFTAENGNVLAYETQYTWYPQYNEWRQDMDASGISWNEVKPVSVSGPEEQTAGNVAFYVTFDQNIVDKTYMFFNADNSWLLSMSAQPNASFSYSADELALLTNYGIKGSLLENIYFNGESILKCMEKETDLNQRPVTVMIHMGYNSLNQIMIVFSGLSGSNVGPNAITDMNGPFEFTFTQGFKTPRSGEVKEDFTFRYDSQTKKFKQVYAKSSAADILSVHYNGEKIEKGGTYTFMQSSLKEDYFFVECALGAELSYSGLDNWKEGKNEIVITVTSSDGSASETFTFYAEYKKAAGCKSVAAGDWNAGAAVLLTAAALLVRRRKHV